MDSEWEGEVVHQGWLTKSPPLENKQRQIFSQSLIQPVSNLRFPYGNTAKKCANSLSSIAQIQSKAYFAGCPVIEFAQMHYITPHPI